MRSIIMFLALLFSACAGSGPYLQNLHEHAKTEYIKQCNLPVAYAVYTDIPEDKIELIEAGFDYWNEATKLPLFFNFGILDYPPNSPIKSVVVIVARDSEGVVEENTCAETRWAAYANGCFSYAYILVSDKCLAHPRDQFETVMRHEAGHVLGLDHSPDFTNLMYRRIESTVQHPLDATPEEINSVIDLYKNK